MAKGRKNACPTNVKDWNISIQDKSQVTETWVRIRGLNEMTHNTDSNTEDGSATTDLWEEPYVSKRNGTIALSGRPLVDAATGEADPGQTMLDDYATAGVCDEDATLKIVDPYGKAIVADFVVTGTETSANETEETKSWDLAQVGEAEPIPYVQVTGVELKDNNTAVTTLALQVGDTAKLITVAIAPADASNQRFRITTGSKRVAQVGNVTDNSFTVTAVGAGTTNIVVTTVNNARRATLAVTVTEGT